MGDDETPANLFRLHSSFGKPATINFKSVKFAYKTLKDELTEMVDESDEQKAAGLVSKLKHRLASAAVKAGYKPASILQQFEEALDELQAMEIADDRLEGLGDEEQVKVKFAVDCLDAVLEFSMGVVGDDWETAAATFAACILASGVNLNSATETTIATDKWAVIDTVDATDFIRLLASKAVSAGTVRVAWDCLGCM